MAADFFVGGGLVQLLILSDSHGLRKELFDIIERHKKDVDFIIHCGDSELEEDILELKGVNIVQGNCDYASFPKEISKTVNGLSLYITHGHLYNVKMTYVPLSYRAEEMEANIVCFGHSHVATTFMENGVVYINPGSLRFPRGEGEQTYAICEVNEKSIDIYFYLQSGKSFDKLNATYKLK